MLHPPRTAHGLSVIAALSVASCAIGCAGDAGLRDTGEAAEESESSLNDAEIAAILIGVHDQRIAQAKAALPKLVDPEIRSFAEHMSMDHAATREELQLVLEASGIVPEDSQVGMELRQASEDVGAILESSSAASIDKDYLDGQVAMHAFVIRTIDQRLTPAARHVELRRALASTRAQFAEHLAEAEKLQLRVSERAHTASVFRR